MESGGLKMEQIATQLLDKDLLTIIVVSLLVLVAYMVFRLFRLVDTNDKRLIDLKSELYSSHVLKSNPRRDRGY